MTDKATFQTPTNVQRELARRARALAQPSSTDAPEAETLHLITFRAGEEHFGVEIERVQEVQPLQQQMWTPVPCTPDFVAGAVNVRGRIYSMIDAARFLGLPARPLAETAHVLLVQGRDQDGEALELGVLADDVPQAQLVLLDDVQPPTTVVSSGGQAYVRGVTQEMLIVLDLARLLADPGLIVNEEA